jgi:hypothetical protein
MFCLAILLSLLQVADAATTYKILNNGGRELNPVMNWLFKRFGMLNVLVVKVILVSAAGIYLYATYPLLLILLCLVYVGVVGWNSYQIYKG